MSKAIVKKRKAPPVLRYVQRTAVAKAGSQPLKKTYEESLKNKEIFDLREEIAVAKGLLSHALAHFDKGKGTRSIIQAIKTITGAVKTLHEIEVGRRYIIDVRQVHVIIEQVVEVIKTEVKDGDTIERISRRFEHLALPGDSDAPEAGR